MNKSLKYKIIIITMIAVFVGMGSVFAYYLKLEKAYEIKTKNIAQKTEIVEERDQPEEPKKTEEVKETKMKESIDHKSEESEKEEEASLPEEKLSSSGTQNFVVCIDPGHGTTSRSIKELVSPLGGEEKPGFVSGTKGVATGIAEKDLNLAVSLKLREELQSHGFKAVMTRDADYCDLSNIDRAELANRENSDLFVRVHANGAGDQTARGIMMLVPSGSNLRDGTIVDKSRSAGEMVLNHIIKSTGAPSNGVIERSDMTGFNWSKVPVILIEMGFMSNPDEDMLMSTPEYQDKLVEGIVNGILEYIKTL